MPHVFLIILINWQLNMGLLASTCAANICILSKNLVFYSVATSSKYQNVRCLDLSFKMLTRDCQNISFGDFKSHLCSILTRTGGGGASGILSGKPGWQRRDYYWFLLWRSVWLCVTVWRFWKMLTMTTWSFGRWANIGEVRHAEGRNFETQFNHSGSRGIRALSTLDFQVFTARNQNWIIVEIEIRQVIKGWF